LRSALSQKVIDSELTAIDNIAFDAPKTKSMVAVLKAFNEPRKTLLVVDEFDQNVVLSANNIPNLKVIEAKGINVYDILNCTNLMMTEKAIKTVEEALA
ncbi:MAG TPA: 50S ribosomal protein L4, partial [Erysipelotrichaceae bacterium]|nr:50S ribosomal protein L4 [Erysipelotrichaceae bacterium]